MIKGPRKLFFYGKMRMDGSRYARTIREELLPYETFFTASPLPDRGSGSPAEHAEYQNNKVFNLKLAAACLDGLLIRPGETFSFWQAVRHADRDTPYRDGRHLVNDEVSGSCSGGLCQLSSMLYWIFLHTPLTVTERHSHTVEQFPPAARGLPAGTDAAISEGWLDLKVRNDTLQVWQLSVNFDEENMYGAIRCNAPVSQIFEIYNSSISYLRDPAAPERILQRAAVCRRRLRAPGILQDDRLLYVNECRIEYEMPEGTEKPGDGREKPGGWPYCGLQRGEVHVRMKISAHKDKIPADIFCAETLTTKNDAKPPKESQLASRAASFSVFCSLVTPDFSS